MIETILSSAEPSAIALVCGQNQISYQQLGDNITVRVNWLKANGVERLAMALDNGLEWVYFDLACTAADICIIPIPGFFSPAQQAHLLQKSGADLLISDVAAEQLHNTPFTDIYYQLNPIEQLCAMPNNTGKITFTSGSTGTPKGVCLSHHSQHVVAQSLVETIGIQQPRHLCLLPLATLLENIAGVYAPLLAGGTVILATSAQRGFKGSRLTDIPAMLALIQHSQPNTLILVPELLLVLLSACQQGWQVPASLQFIAVGGAKVSASLLNQAKQAGLPVYQGYGLSECVSVVALNTAKHDIFQSVGKVLAHNQITQQSGEIVVRGNLFLGYLDEPETFHPEQVLTGDRGRVEDGYVYVEGRTKHLIINSFGRNVSPEWIEAELIASGLFAQTIVLGEARPHCVALLVPISKQISEAQITFAIGQINAALPDYGQIKAWSCISPMTYQAGLLTANGKLQRANISHTYQRLVESLYQSDNQFEVEY
ncbi:AMP-binding protein [Aliiglaciecola sp. LCG003]|uniref:AMP-binding protein n=1 Tax=Aliiglaciecola sp. LCG003 TaxID=3053655 RepID=UPI00257445F2|nr:AMP-binding protein [Aliiglaciecola sp. LCG003]WJG09189.1 AMP-binding protein [Aliiglaciecola sp. LCG003]